MEVSRLLKDELVHEVGVRGYVAEYTDTVASLSKQLKKILSAEERGEVVRRGRVTRRHLDGAGSPFRHFVF